jgi:hypothetical protein
MNRDPLQGLFDAVDPTKDMTDAQLDARLSPDALFLRIEKQSDVSPVKWLRRRTWRRAAIISTSAVLVLAGSAAAISILRAPVSNTSQFSCYSQDTTHSKVIAVLAYTPKALSSCQSALHWKPDPKGATPKGFLCVLSDGTLGGFPPSRGVEDCAKLGLAVFNGTLKYPEVLRFENSATKYFSSHLCVTPSVGRTRMRVLFREFDMTHWRVQLTRVTTPSACETFGIEPGHRLVDLVGFPRSPTGGPLF